MNNIKNKLVTKKFIEDTINRYTTTKFKVNNLRYYQTAFIQKSFFNNCQENSESDSTSNLRFDYLSDNNERYEFLGDRAIDFITAEFLFDLYPGKDEGFLTKLKSRIVRKESLAKLGAALNFKEYILISCHVERNDGRENPRFLEDIFESFIGGFYKDQNSNIGIVREFLLGVYKEFVNINELVNVNDNFKDSLLRYFHFMNYGHPVYTSITNCYQQVSSKKEFTCVLLLKKGLLKGKTPPHSLYEEIKSKQLLDFKTLETNDILGIGSGETKKISEQMCSKNCLINLGISVNY
jgi:ribonuclease-3